MNLVGSSVSLLGKSAGGLWNTTTNVQLSVSGINDNVAVIDQNSQEKIL